jgi:hypothetical protein
VTFICAWKYCAELIGRCEVHRVIKTWVGTHTTLEASRAAVDFSEQLNLQPALVMLDCLGWCKWSGYFGNANEADRGNQIDETLWYAHQGANLTDCL